MSEVKAIKVSKETYAKLSEIAGEMQITFRWPVSIEEALKDLIKRREIGRKISDLAGSRNITDPEFKEIKKTQFRKRGKNGAQQNHNRYGHTKELLRNKEDAVKFVTQLEEKKTLLSTTATNALSCITVHTNRDNPFKLCNP